LKKKTAMGYIELKKMKFYAYHGVLEQERKVGNYFTVDLKLFFDFSKSFLSDNLKDTINYAAVFEVVKAEMNIPSNLLEHLAGRIVDKIKQSFPQIESIEIRLAKKNPPVDGEIEEAVVVF
jgi:dihydroneopterin aldolase